MESAAIRSMAEELVADGFEIEIHVQDGDSSSKKTMQVLMRLTL